MKFKDYVKAGFAVALGAELCKVCEALILACANEYLIHQAKNGDENAKAARKECNLNYETEETEE